MTRQTTSSLPVKIIAVGIIATGFLAVAVLAASNQSLIGGGGGAQGGGGGGGEQITVASIIAYPPFEFERNGEPVGFDIDLMNEIGKRVGFKPEYNHVPVGGIIPSLGKNFYDASISAMTITKGREKSVDFSDPYFNADQSLMVQSDSPIKSVDDIDDATVGVQIGTTGNLTAKVLKQQGKITGEIRTFNTIPEAFSALESGQIEAVINDFPASAYWAETGGRSLEIVQIIPTGEQYGIAFPKNSDLVEPVNKALGEIKKDGTYAKIYEKWFGQKPKEIP
jgi:ABC-type amino acid transport substrate-binding protein